MFCIAFSRLKGLFSAKALVMLLAYLYRYKAGTPPVRAYYFPIASINSEVAQKVWADVQLTQPIPNEHEMESLKFRFNPTNGNYWIGVVQTGAGDHLKNILITVSPEGEFIDAIDVIVRGTHRLAGYIHVMQWQLDENMKVTTYRIKPTQTTPIPWDNQASSFYGQRIDTEYQVTPQGQFVKLNEVKYVPKTYTYQYLADENRADENSNFWDGNETRIE